MAGRRQLWASIVLVFWGFAIAGPAVMARDAQQVRARPGPSGPLASEPLVVIADLRFEPLTLRVREGTVVVWSNQDIAPHTVTTDITDSGLIDPGASFSMTADATFEYVCTLHLDMFGTVEVS